MSDTNGSENPNKEREARGITGLTVAGFKSISESRTIEIRPLTILAGANSSGKSSIMQPLLLLKQTLQLPYDPENILLLNGPTLNFASANQFLSNKNKNLEIGFELTSGTQINTCLALNSSKNGLEVKETTINIDGQSRTYRLNMSTQKILATFSSEFQQEYLKTKNNLQLKVTQNRVFLHSDIEFPDSEDAQLALNELAILNITRVIEELGLLQNRISKVIYVSALRGWPERIYPITDKSKAFNENFDAYFPNVIFYWQYRNTDELKKLAQDLSLLELNAYGVRIRQLSNTQIELEINCLVLASKNEFINFADVGVGISSILSVLVALQAAQPGQLVYIEQPELHLHPKAQVAMAHVLANAAQRGVRVVLETHSDLLLIGIQTLVAEGELDPNLVKLHWFSRDKNGITQIASADLNEEGSFGKWPQDFGSTSLHAQKNYLDAVSNLYNSGQDDKASNRHEHSTIG